MRFLYEQYEKKLERGKVALKQGRAEKARTEFLGAAELLFKIALKTDDPKLKAARVQNARTLMDMANSAEKRVGGGAGVKEPNSPGGKQGDFILKERPSVTFEDVAGLDGVKEELRLKLLYPLQHPETAERYGIRHGGGVLLYGPPGTGKTLLAKAVAGEIDAPFYSVRPADILSRYVGDAERNIEKLFREAREHPLSIIFIDEIEALAPSRSEDNTPVMKRLVPQLLAELEGIDSEGKNPTLFLGATNVPWELDEAILRPGRFDRTVYVGLPDSAARKVILYMNLHNKPLGADMDLDGLAELTEGYSGADIRGLCETVTGAVFLEAIRTGNERELSMGDFRTAMAGMKPSVNAKTLEKYELFG